ncbi:sensor protein ZraS, partial [Klebsiella pneumoniae]|nr:sensor protein ZraS [Klebsiella pneumoniae]
NSRWRLLEDAEKTPALEVYRLFQPMSLPWRHGMHNMPRCNGKAVPQAEAQQAIFIAVDASDLVATQSGEKRNTLIILFALATVLLASVLS